MEDYKSVVECNQVDTIAVVEVEEDWIVATSAVVDNRSAVVAGTLGTVDMGLVVPASFIPLST